MIDCLTCGSRNHDAAQVCSACGVSLNASAGAGNSAVSLPPGTTLDKGKYVIRKMLGQGGFAITYLAEEVGLKSLVAIKEFLPCGGCMRSGRTVHPGGSLDPATYRLAVASFRNEAVRLRSVNHPGVVQIYGVFEENNTAYIVMEYLNGRTLHEMAEQSPLPQAEALAHITKVAGALDAVHAKGMLHRDVKPENIILVRCDDGSLRVVLFDFGAAREFIAGKTYRQTAILTPGYAPLEQYGQQARFDAYTDVYALAATCYYLLTSKDPVPATDRVNNVELPPVKDVNPSVTDPVSAVVVQGMEMNALQRPHSAGEFASLLRAASSSGPRQPPPIPTPPNPSPPNPTPPGQVWPGQGQGGQTPGLPRWSWASLAALATVAFLSWRVGAASHPERPELQPLQPVATLSPAPEGNHPAPHTPAPSPVVLRTPSESPSEVRPEVRPNPPVAPQPAPVAPIPQPVAPQPAPVAPIPQPVAPQPRPSATLPRPVVRVVGLPRTASVGQPLEFRFRATNVGAATPFGSITASFSGAPEVSILEPTTRQAKVWQPEEMMWNALENASKAISHVTAEAYWDRPRWRNGIGRDLTVRVIPRQAGVMRVWYRATLTLPEAEAARRGVPRFYGPADATENDQQGFSAIVQEVTINE